MTKNKYEYLKVIQQHYGAYGWEDVSEYETDSKGNCIGESLHSGVFVPIGTQGRQRELTCLAYDVKEYRLTGYPTRVIFRKVKKEEIPLTNI